MRLMLLGCPGAGKGTQAKIITEKFSIPQISTGDMLRAAITAKTTEGLMAKKIMEEGGLVSDDIMIQLVKDRINQPDCKRGFLLDGFPRTIPQAEALEQNGIVIDTVIEISVPDEELIKRLSGRRVHVASGRVYHISNNPPKIAGLDDVTGEELEQRTDDHEDTIRKRLAIYHQQTEPLVDYYASSKHSEFFRVDGTQGMSEVSQSILNKLNMGEKSASI